MSYTWADFKYEMQEIFGIKDDDEIWFIDINKKECEAPIIVDQSDTDKDGHNYGYMITNYPNM